MKTVNIAKLKNNFSKFLALVEKGEEVRICKRNIAIAKLTPIQKHEKGKYPFKYEPSVVKKDNNIKYIFPNMSGNEINNAGCLKVTKQLSR